jgi:hypothetical protein
MLRTLVRPFFLELFGEDNQDQANLVQEDTGQNKQQVGTEEIDTEEIDTEDIKIEQDIQGLWNVEWRCNCRRNSFNANLH